MIVCTLKQYIDRRDLNITALSKRCGISRPPLIALANGTSKGIQFDTLEKLCGFFGITPSDLLLRIDEHAISIIADFSSIDFAHPVRTICSGDVSIGSVAIGVEALITVGEDFVDVEIRLDRNAASDEKVSFILDVIQENHELHELFRESVETQTEKLIIELVPKDGFLVSATLVL